MEYGKQATMFITHGWPSGHVRCRKNKAVGKLEEVLCSMKEDHSKEQY